MATRGDVNFRVSVDTGTAAQELGKLGTATTDAARKAEDLSKSGDKAAKSTEKLGNSAGDAQRALGNLAASLGAAFTFQQLVDAAAKFESVKVGLQTVS